MLGINVACNLVFLAELLLRAAVTAGPAWWSALWSGHGAFECAMAACGLVGAATGQEVLILLPILRILRLMRFVPTMHGLLVTLVQTRKTFAQLVLFAALCFVTFAVLSRYFFRDGMASLTRSHFSDLGQALLTTFQLFTGDQWR